MQRNPIHVVGISGSLRPGSYTRMAVELALRGAGESGVEATLIDLRDYDLPFSAGKEKLDSRYPDLARLRAQVRAAQGIILGSPEYHGSFSGVLKNALDLMGFEEFEGKMLGLVAVAGGKMGAVHTLNGLRLVGRSLHAWVVPEQVSISEVWKAFDAHGNLTDRHLDAALRRIGSQVARFANLHDSEHALEFLRLWESAPENPGGGREES